MNENVEEMKARMWAMKAEMDAIAKRIEEGRPLPAAMLSLREDIKILERKVPEKTGPLRQAFQKAVEEPDPIRRAHLSQKVRNMADELLKGIDVKKEQSEIEMEME